MDTRDHQFILGATNPSLRGKSLASLLAEAIAAGKTGHELQARPFGRLIMDEEVVEQAQAGHEGEDHGANEPFVAEEDVGRVLRLEQRVGGNVMGGHVVVDLVV